MSKKPLLLILLLSCASASAQDSPPVLLRNIFLSGPIEASGRYLAPEVKVRIVVDERGKVSKVDVLSLNPSTNLDAAFKREAVIQLQNLRYAPARVGGKPKATTLEWTLRFGAAAESSNKSGENTLPEFLKIDLIPPEVEFEKFELEQHAQFYFQPFEEKKKRLLEMAQIAERHIDKQHRQEFTSKYFVVVTDSPTKGAAEWAAGNLDAAYEFLDDYWRAVVEPMPDRLKILVFLVATGKQFNAITDELKYPGTAAHRRPTAMHPGFVVYPLELPSIERLVATLIHEASHVYNQRRLQAPYVNFPKWLEEGFAEYVGNSEIKDGLLVPGKIVKRRYVINNPTLGDGPDVHLRQSVAGADLEVVKKNLSAKEPLTVKELVGLSYDDFIDLDNEKTSLHYAAGWILVHFLNHGRPEWQGLFQKMMLYVAEGYPADQAIEVIYGFKLTEIEEEFRAYVKRL